MRKFLCLILITVGLALIAGCSITQERTMPPVLQPASENELIAVPESASPAIGRWNSGGHSSLASIAASQWGLSGGRAAALASASTWPDVYQAGLDNGYNQQWSHAYIYDDWFGYTYYFWGDAEEDCHDNIDGPQGGEGYNGGWAGSYYATGNQVTGDQYLGYAIHFIEDVSIVVHSTSPTSLGVTVPYYTADMITNHFAFESWVDNNLTAGHRLLDAVSADYYYYPVTDIKQSVKNAAWASCAYKGTSSVGWLTWSEYKKSGYPTGTGTGSAALVSNAKKMLIAAGRYAKGLLKYTLDRYSQWGSKY
jgi:hypothetical protein